MTTKPASKMNYDEIEKAKKIVRKKINDEQDITLNEFFVLLYDGNYGGATDYVLEKHPEYLNAQDDMGRTPVIMATLHGNPRMVQYFIDKGADVTIKDKAGSNAVENYEIYRKDRAGPDELRDLDEYAPKLKEAELKVNQIKGAKDVASLRQSSKLGEGVPLPEAVGSFLTGETGSLKTQGEKVRAKYAGRRKTRKGKNKVYRKRTMKK
jgi:ankyrin repeat protein